MKAKQLFLTSLCLVLLFAVAGTAVEAQNDIEKKIGDIIAKMTIEEKAGQLAQYNLRDISAENLKIVKQEIRDGNAGSYLNLTRDNGVQLHNELQKIAVEQSRSGIPLIFGFDVIHGYRTVFPIPLGQSCSWNLELAQQVASIAAKEAAAAGHDWTFAPMIDIARDPRWGRIAESFGEDTYLCSLFTAAKVKGFQGDDLTDPLSLVACLKHYAAYGAAQAGRDYHTVDISMRTLRNIYLPPFKAGVKAGAATLMSSFNEINGIPTTADPFLLNDVLRGEWGFDGFVVSDYNSVGQLVNHGVAKDQAQAGVQTVAAGGEMFMETRGSIAKLPQQVKNGNLPEKVLDEAVRRILRIKFRAGIFDNPYVDPRLVEKVTLTAENLKLARKLARESMVLLKNEGDILPLKRKKIKTIGIIGPMADNQKDILGTWSPAGKPDDAVTVIEGIKQKLAPGTEVLYAKGCEFDGDSTDGFPEAVSVAVRSDVVIMAIGESIEHNGEGHSRVYLDLPGVQQQLVKLIKATHKPVVVVLFTGRPLAINYLAEKMPALLVAWHPGIQGGPAIADVLFGDYNPSGKLTTTFPRSVGQVPIFYNHKNTGRPPQEEVHYSSKYIDSPWTPLYPFGYGISYTKFEYSNLKISADKIKFGDSVIVTADIKNIGKLAGEEIAQLYIRDLVGSVTRPVKELKGFKKVKLEPGQRKTVSFIITGELLSFYNDKMKYVLEPGDFKVFVGPDSTSGLVGSFEILPKM